MRTAREQAAIWDAINHYAQTCGGDTSATTVSDGRMRAVAAVERAIAAAVEEALAEEREHCAAVADAAGCDWDTSRSGAKSIASAIRARSGGKTP